MPDDALATLTRDVETVDRAEIGLTPEQRALRRAVREFARAEIAPKVDELERTGTYPRELVREVGRLGYLYRFYAARQRADRRHVSVELCRECERRAGAHDLQHCRGGATAHSRG